MNEDEFEALFAETPTSRVVDLIVRLPQSDLDKLVMVTREDEMSAADELWVGDLGARILHAVHCAWCTANGWDHGHD